MHQSDTTLVWVVSCCPAVDVFDLLELLLGNECIVDLCLVNRLVSCCGCVGFVIHLQVLGTTHLSDNCALVACADGIIQPEAMAVAGSYCVEVLAC